MIHSIIQQINLLREKSHISKIDMNSLRIAQTLKDSLIDTWQKNSPGFAISAPQIAEFERIIAIAEDGHNPDAIRVMFNPLIVEQSGKQIFWESCLSFPCEAGLTERPHKVVVQYYDENGCQQEIFRKGLPAIVLCHEIDHLNGNLFQDIAIKTISFSSPEEKQVSLKELRETQPLQVLDEGIALSLELRQ